MNMNSAPGMNMPPQQPPMPVQPEAPKNWSNDPAVIEMYGEGIDATEQYGLVSHLSGKKQNRLGAPRSAGKKRKAA